MWLRDKALQILNYIPELFLKPDDPLFDIVRWWLVFVLAIVAACIVVLAWRAFRRGLPPSA
jgi:hypothetical protein